MFENLQNNLLNVEHPYKDAYVSLIKNLDLKLSQTIYKYTNLYKIYKFALKCL